MLTKGGEVPGIDRFLLLRRLGSGSVGVVYEALDRDRSGRVALKTLHHLDADGVYYLKREFRALCHVVHPNLVQLYELHSVDERWFFTMELVEGVDFLRYVRHGGPLDAGRLRAALLQLALGVQALHGAGKLHRDIKPSNALVTAHGRVVLLDFGLATDMAAGRLYQTLEPKLVGTPAYLAPEQAATQALSPACDWYSVGALLYQALTGVLPFDGGLFQVLSDKQARDPPAPRTLDPAVSRELETLCLDLLQRRPEDRPDGDEVLRRLGAVEGSSPRLTPGPIRVAPWVGRTQHLAALGDALDTVRGGRSVVVFAHGESGVGKTALVQRFLDAVAIDREVVALSGRCYERELVPYRALDSLIDGLARYLMTLPPPELEVLLPRDMQAAARLFPVLRRVEALSPSVSSPSPPPAAEPADPPELRRRAFSALRELLGRIADRKTLVLHIDDLQWGDADSAALLRHLLAPPAAPVALLIFGYRTEDEGSVCLAALKEDSVDGPFGGPETVRRELPVGPLDPPDAALLARTLLGDSGSPHADLVVSEAAGNPFFIGELVEHVRRSGGRAAGVTLDEVLRDRIFGLGEAAQRVLEALALVGRPLARELCNRAAGLPASDDQPLSLLRSSHLVRARGSTEQGQIEISHDRIRVAVVAAMPGERLRATHRQLALALGSAGDVDPELVAVHFEGAGELALAGEQAARAAARADEALAFDRASRLYRWALALTRGDDRQRAPLQARLGDALANLGRGAEAAEAYLEAAPGASAAGALDLRRRAAEQFLYAGHLDHGLAALREVLRSLRIRLAPTPRRALLSLASRRALLRLRGLHFRERDTSQIAPEDLVRLDVFWSVSTALSVIDVVRASDFQARHLLLALRLGEPYRIARALGTEVAISAQTGNRSARRTAALIQAAESVAARVDRPFARGWATLSAGIAAYLEGRHQPARELCERAEKIFQGCTGVWWEVGSGRLFSLWALFYLGELAELGRRVPLYLEEAVARGDNYSATNLRGGVLSWLWLAADDPDRADEEMDSAMRRWSGAGFHSQHFWHMLTNANAHLYRGDPRAALDRVNGQWRPLTRSLLLRVQIARTEAFELRARCGLALAATSAGVERRRLLAGVHADLGRLRREATAVAQAQAHILTGGLAALAADEGAAATSLRAALDGFDAAGMALHAAVARWRLGELRGGEEGVRLRKQAAEWFAMQGVRSPERVLETLSPGF